ncbi:unnamed protein product [Urochloa decumbens]|uniref:BHLH domain-containing protein n=1 Tax=Urochloa decumbens TaxID=240449 RepID=A0ABC9GEE8_9POAL
MMNYPAGHAAAGPWCYPDDAGEARNTTTSFADDMIADHYFTDDLFQLAWSGSGAPGSMPAAAARSPPPPPEVRFDPPSEGEMAAWLISSIVVRGEGLASNNDGSDVPAVTKKPSDDTSTAAADKKEKLPLTEGMGSTEQEMRKPRAGGSSRRSHTHHGEAHKLTEKRRRHKINERLRTLQQLVPGCDDKSNQTATLDQAIQYMKSLQHYVQAMPDGPAACPPLPAPCHAVPPAVAPATAMPMPAAPMMVPAMLQLPHYPAPVPVLMLAAAAQLYPVAAPPTAVSASHRRHGSSSSKRNGSSRSLRKKH